MSLITHFAADKEFIIADFESCLMWETIGAHTVEISPVIGRANGTGSYMVLIQRDTRFTLTATSYFGYKSQAEIIIRILPLPLIEQLLVPSIRVDASINLEYKPINSTQLKQPGINISNLSFTDLDASLIHIPDIEINIQSNTPKLSEIQELLNAVTARVLAINKTRSKYPDNESI
jgi:hypothetical protein